jgi:hypothetical protein
MASLLSELLYKTTKINFQCDSEKLACISNESSFFSKTWHDDCCLLGQLSIPEQKELRWITGSEP